MMYANCQPSIAARLQGAWQAGLQRAAALLDADRTGRPSRSEVFRRVQHEKWLGSKPTPPAARPRYGDLYKRPLVDLNDRRPERGNA